MTINIRAKGQNGEREIANALNNVVIEVREALGFAVIPERDLPFQRNQNQSAVGGSDLSNPFGLAIEVKRQEQLNLNTWWAQCLEQAECTNCMPILLYRKNKQAWRCRMLGYMSIHLSLEAWRTNSSMPIEVSFEDFLACFKEFYAREISK
jgi:hypothetical protein